MIERCFKLILVALCLLGVQSVAFAADARMQVDVLADQQQVEVSWLHSNVQKAAALALPQLWNRIIPQSAHGLIPKRVKAILFLKKASPTATGMRIIFHQKRVLAYLKKNKLPYIAQQPALNVVVQMYNQAGSPMQQTANALLDDATRLAMPLGYRVDDQGASLVLLWRWLDHQHIRLNVRGNSRLNEFSETRQLQSGDPLKQLKPWLHELLLQARDAYAESAAVKSDVLQTASNQADPVVGTAAMSVGQTLASQATNAQMSGSIMSNSVTSNSAMSNPALSASSSFTKSAVELQLRVMRQASLAEQVLFENELHNDPRILNLSLRQVNQEGQQYRLQLKGSDDQWLTAWFARRGMTLTPTIEGWVAR